jgi:class 3 adenylate cyclase
MSELQDSKYSEGLARRIVDSRREVTILFTDIEFSTMHWSELGDVEGRPMVDHHNRLVFPVIRGFHAKVIKTIGDAVMASFKHPEHVLKAAIGIQQVLRRARDSGEGFCCRIGIHTATGIVERDNVFGDLVNIAAPVDGQCRGNEILLSETSIAGLPTGEFLLIEDGARRPKAFRDEIRLYRCDWQDHPSLVDDIRPSPILPLGPRDKLDLLVYVALSIGILYFLYLKYLRYAIADFEPLAPMFLNAPVFGSNPFSKLGQYNKLSQYHPATPASMAH